MNIDGMVEALKNGNKVTRKAWNRKLVVFVSGKDLLLIADREKGKIYTYWPKWSDYQAQDWEIFVPRPEEPNVPGE